MMTYTKTFKNARKWSKLTKRNGVWTLSNGYRYQPAKQVLTIGSDIRLGTVFAKSWLSE